MRPVRKVHLEKGSHRQDGGTDAENNVLEQLKKCVKALQHSQQRKTRSGRKKRRVGSRGIGKDDGCWGCGQPGHFQQDCAKIMQQAHQNKGEDDSATSVQDQGNGK